MANLGPASSRETGPERPVLIIQADELITTDTPTLAILPITTTTLQGVKRWRINIPARGRLARPAQVIVDQPRTLDRTRLRDGPMTSLTAREMASVQESLSAVLGME